jgi:hypothetical protein
MHFAEFIMQSSDENHKELKSFLTENKELNKEFDTFHSTIQEIIEQYPNPNVIFSTHNFHKINNQIRWLEIIDPIIDKALDNKGVTFFKQDVCPGATTLTHTQKLMNAKKEARKLLKKHLEFKDKYFYFQPIFEEYVKQTDRLFKSRRRQWISLACYAMGAIALASLPQIAHCAMNVAKLLKVQSH